MTIDFYLMDHSLTDPLTTNYFFKPRQTITVTCMPVSMTFNNELPYSNITDDSLSDELLPENNLHEGQTLALYIVLDTDHIDYSALGNIEHDLNILLDNNTMNCKYFTEMELQCYHLLKCGSLNMIYLYTISHDIPMCTS